jgi:hypothetical protein
MKYYLRRKGLKKWIWVVNYLKIKKGNKITSKGVISLKESLIKNKFLKEIDFYGIYKIKIRKLFKK